MNWYEHHLGDYARDTAHLSMIEDGAYRRLLDRYYATEKPIPVADVYRIARCRDECDRHAVDVVTGEFFTLDGDVFRHKRCDEVISEFAENEPERDAKKANAKERKRLSRERRKSLFEQLRLHGEVPAFDTPIKALEAMLSRVTGQDVTRDRTVTSTGQDAGQPCDGTITQPPLPTTQPPVEKKKRKAAPSPAATAELPDWVDRTVWDGFVEMRKRKRAPMTERAQVLVIQALTKYRDQGEDPNAMLDQSIRNTWTDVYPVRVDEKQYTTLTNGRAPSTRRVGLTDMSRLAHGFENEGSDHSQPAEARRLAAPVDTSG